MEVFEEIYQGAFRPDFEKRGKAYEAVSEKLREKIQAFSAGLTDDQWRLLDEIMTLSADWKACGRRSFSARGCKWACGWGFPAGRRNSRRRPRGPRRKAACAPVFLGIL